MAENELQNLEQDPRFPSGPWTGFFLQYWLPGRHTTNLAMTIRDGQLAGTGADWVGPFNIEGDYDTVSGKCQWIKRYIGKHSVTYRGVNDGHGIWGVWEIRQLAGLYIDRGGFHIWPEGSDVSEESARTEKAVIAMMRKEFGSKLYRIIRGLVILGAIAALVVLLRMQWTTWTT